MTRVHRTRTLLIVDDNREDLRVYARWLRRSPDVFL